MRHRYRHLALLCAALCALPAAALAQSSGGTQFGDPAATAPTALPAKDAVLLGHTMHVRGTLSNAAGQTIVIERREADGPWEQATTTVAGNDGSFDAAWKTDHIGHFALRARRASADGSDTAAAAAALPTSAITVFRSTIATWFGPGFYGHRTACGQRLTHHLLGVAHRTLPCGTKVALLYKGRTITVPVVDRGPFGHGASYDLTSATAEALGVTQTARIGAVRAG
jgi:rare lipoprotein A (peptidoglycan hydrolase)